MTMPSWDYIQKQKKALSGPQNMDPIKTSETNCRQGMWKADFIYLYM